MAAEWGSELLASSIFVSFLRRDQIGPLDLSTRKVGKVSKKNIKYVCQPQLAFEAHYGGKTQW